MFKNPKKSKFFYPILSTSRRFFTAYSVDVGDFFTAYSVDVGEFYHILSMAWNIFYRILSRHGIFFTAFSVGVE